MNAYASMTCKQLAANYRVAYASHQALAQAYADGAAAADELRSSANNLKAMRTAYAAEREANQVRAH